MSIKIDSIEIGDKVTFEDEQGNIIDIDYEADMIWFDVPDPNVNGLIEVDVHEPKLVEGWS